MTQINLQDKLVARKLCGLLGGFGRDEEEEKDGKGYFVRHPQHELDAFQKEEMMIMKLPLPSHENNGKQRTKMRNGQNNIGYSDKNIIRFHVEAQAAFADI